MFEKKRRKIVVNGQTIELEPKKKWGSKLFNKGKNIKVNKNNTLNFDNASNSSSNSSSNASSLNNNINKESNKYDFKTLQNPSSLDFSENLNSSLNSKDQNISKSSANTYIKADQDIEKFNQEIDQKIKNINSKKTNKNKEKSTKFRIYIENIASKHKGLEDALTREGIKSSLYEFIMRILTASIILGVLVGVTLFFVFIQLTTLITSIFVSFLLGFVIFYTLFNIFINYPFHKSKKSAKNVEKNILFAARDMIISLRSGMPVYNAISSVSTGYGDTSKEFAKIVEHVELGTSLEQAIDLVVSKSKSKSFKRIMLQATTSIKSGADITTSLQSVIDQLSQERVIELRRYGQRLNALAMFYMLFGVILPSMGIAVMTILTTFISIFTINMMTLELVFVGIVILQIIFLELIKQRPVFSM